jgi:hypothetical protein
MPFPHKAMMASYTALFAAMVVWSFVLWQSRQTTSTWNYLFNVGCAFFFLSGGLIALFQAMKPKIKSAVDHELIAVGIGVILFGTGLSIWSYYNLVLNVESPFPSLSDAVYVLYSPILTYGLINLLRVTGARITKRFYLEFLALFAVISFFILTQSNPPDLSSELPFITKFLNVYYLLADALLLSLGLMIIRVTKGKIHNSFFFFLIAIFSMAIADFTFFYRSAEGIYYNGDIGDVFYALSGFMFATGIIKIVATQSILDKYLKDNNNPKVN